MRLIDADALKEVIEEKATYIDGDSEYKIIGLIDNAPTILLSDFKEGYEQAKIETVRPPQYWIEDDTGHFYCPQCKKYPDYQIRLMNFCPNCGCDLRGEI